MNIRILLLLFTLFLTNSSVSHKEPRHEISAHIKFQVNLLSDLLRSFSQTISAYTYQEDPANLIKQFKQCRNEYKKIEWLYTYMLPEDAKSVNGPPLPKLNENTVSIEVLDPKGFQVIEEIITGEEIMQEKEKLEMLVQDLINSFYVFDQHLNEFPPSDRIIFEALRSNIVRISFLGLTGFDSPQLKNSLEENAISWNASQLYLSYYQDFFLKVDKKKTHQIIQLFKKGNQCFISEKNFNKFDRFNFIQNCADPLYGLLFELHSLSGIETIKEVTSANIFVNYEAKSMFASDFLNPQAYSRNTHSRKNSKAEILGKMLFFDPVMSKNNDRSCASCHLPEKGFSDGMARSVAMGNQGTVDRNSPGLINSVFATKYFYDFRINYLEEQVEHVIKDHREFATDFTEISKKLRKSNEYATMFKESFGITTEEIGSTSISHAIAAYIRSLVAFDSPFDQQIRGEIKSVRNIRDGFNLFMGKSSCGTCHFAPVFNGTVPPFYNDSESEVLGVPGDTAYSGIDEDLGRSGFYKFNSEIYRHSFKTTTVRNSSLTSPYMHNGIFKNMEEVIQFYNDGGGAGRGFQVLNQTLPSEKLNLNDYEKKCLIDFMKSLTDTTGLTSRPALLPSFKGQNELNERRIGGVY